MSRMTAAEQQMVELLKGTIHTQTSLLEAQAKQLETQAKQLEELLVINAEQGRKIEELLKKIDELSGGPKDSHNSSKPPSSDGYKKKPAPKSLKKPNGKKQGGQSGHKGSGMKITQEPDEIVVHYPDACQNCPHHRECKSRVCEGRYEIDVLAKRNVILHQQIECLCRRQAEQPIRGEFPKGITGTKQYGNNVITFATALNTVGMVSLDRVGEFLSSVMDIQISTGTLKNRLAQLKGVLDAPVRYIREKIMQRPVLHFDETGIRAEGRLHWLHCACDRNWAYFFVHQKRGRKAIEAMDVLPGYHGIAVSDCWPSYLQYSNVTHALCNAHLARELVYAHENMEQPWAGTLKDLLFEILAERNRLAATGQTSFPPEQLDQYRFRAMELIRTGLEQNPVPERTLGTRGRPAKGKIRVLLERIRDHMDEFFRFAHNWNVPFSNNEAERSIRF